MISIAIIEDIDEIRESIKEFLSAQNDFIVASASNSVETFLSYNHDLTPEILLLDIGLPGMSGLSGIKFIKQKFPQIDIIILSVYNDPDKIFEALCLGAVGYLLKNTPLPKILESLRDCASGGSPISPQIAKKVIEFFKPKSNNQTDCLTDKEKQIVDCLVEGLSYKETAERLINSVDTIRHHIKNIYKKLHVNSKAEVINKILKNHSI